MVPRLAALVACSAFLLLQAGEVALAGDAGQPPTSIVLTGRVVDEQGAAVAGARVRVAYSRIATKTDTAGRFRIAGLEAGNEWLFILASGKAPCLQEVDVKSGMDPLEITARPPQTVQFRVVDQEGEPVEDAAITSQRWEGVFASDVVSLRTDAKGVATWNEAPADEIEYSVSKDGYARAVLRAAPRAGEHEVTLHPLLIISGTVTNFTTGEPIEEFRVVPVIFFRAGSSLIPRRLAETAKSGKYSMEFARAEVEHAVQIEAPGFMTVRSERYRIGKPSPVLHFRLKPVARAIGQVVDDQGTPVADAGVYVATASQRFNVGKTDPGRRSQSDNYETVTKEDGSFEIVPQFEDYCVVVMCSRGYAEVNRNARETPGRIEVQPWARVEGRLLQDGQPVPSWPVKLDPIRLFAEGQPCIDDRLWTVTDNEGRFVFQRVPPGPCSVKADLSVWKDCPLSSSRSVPLDVASGEDIALVLGGEAADVIGRVRLDPSAQTDIDYHFSLNYLVAKRPGIKPPPAIAGKGFDWRKGWTDAWRSSAEGKAYLTTLHHHFVKLAPDGSFRVGGVSPGEYELSLQVYHPPEKSCLVHPLGKRVVRFRVEGGSGTVDLGEVVVEAMRAPKVGEQAPNVQFKELDGTVVDISEFRGQHVLLDFWATWCGPCVKSLAEVERIHSQYGKDGCLVVVALNLDADKGTAQAFVRQRKLPWRHAFLGDWAETTLPERFAVSTLPTYVLIGPQGKLLGQSRKLEEIVSILDSATRQWSSGPERH